MEESERSRRRIDEEEQIDSKNRARSLGRSRSRGRSNPSELLARKQQLLSNGQLDVSWTADGVVEAAAATSTLSGPQAGHQSHELHRRSQTRRAKQHLQEFSSSGANGSDHQVAGYNQQRPSSVEAKLESLTGELLKNHHKNERYTNDALQTPQTITTSSSSTAKSIDDVYILLAKKEKDLQLAAELGKVLLEKNDELSKANEKITEDYSHKLELLEQDKHRLKRKLDQLDGEYENRLIELQTDCNILKNQLDDQQQLARQAEKEKSKLIDDLVQQNQRLTSELVEATKSEELLSSQLEQMNERFNVRMSNRQDHVAQLDALKEEIQIVNQRKQDLERRLKLASNDKNNLNAALDESGDKILLLENLLNEKDGKLSELMDEVSELRDSSLWLSNELESMISLNEKLATTADQLDGDDNGHHQQATTTVGGLQLASQRKRSQLVEQLKELRLKTCSRLKANEFMLINRQRASSNNGRRLSAIKPTKASLTTTLRRASNNSMSKSKRKRKKDASLFDELDESTNGGANNRSPTSQNGYSQDNSEDEEEDDNEDAESEGEEQRRGRVGGGEWSEDVALEIFTLLRRFHMALQHRKDGYLQTTTTTATSQQSYNNPTSVAQQQHLYSPNSTDDSGISADDIEKLEQAQARDPGPWKRLLTSLKSLIEEMPCSTCQLMIAERADYEQLQKLHAKVCDEMRRKNDELLALSVAKTEQETKLAALEEKCNILTNDLSNCDMPKEEIVKLAWKARDEAVERKNGAEISLAKTRIENMQIASQLMEVVQQKGELSQKLAQFEDDIHYITQDSVKAKFTWEEYAEKLRRSKATQPDSTNNNSNPLAQLLSFSVASSRDTNGGNAKSSAMDNINQPTSLMRNLTSNRFNLRFWQRSSTENKATDKGVAGNKTTTTTTTNVVAEQKAS